jgi:hypothetical protein
MKRLFVVCLFLSFGLAVSAWGADPFVGTWKVNTEKSKASTGQPGAKEEVVKIEEQGGNLLVTIKGTSAAGKAYSDQYTVPRKGNGWARTAARIHRSPRAAIARPVVAPSSGSIMKQTGHRSVQMVRRYIRGGSLFRENSAGKLGL